MKKKMEERNRQMEADRESGMTLRAIAKKYGISVQRVHQIIGGRLRERGPFIAIEECPYPNLKNWMNRNRVSRYEITRRVYGVSGSHNCISMRGYIRGDFDPPKRIIDRLIAVTGMPYEVLFALEDNGCEDFEI